MNEPKISERGARALVALVHEIRPTWDEPGIKSAIDKAVQSPRCVDDAHLVVACVRAAAEVTNRTPAVIALDGEHWRERVREPERKITVGTDAELCGRCHAVLPPADLLAEHTCKPAGMSAETKSAIEEAKARAAEATARIRQAGDEAAVKARMA